MPLLNYTENMNTLNVTIKPSADHSQNIQIEMDVSQFERMAIALGFFNQEFLESLDRAESDYKAGRVKKIKSLKSLTRQ